MAAKPAASFAQFGADAFVVVERWASMQALQAHAVAPHMKASSMEALQAHAVAPHMQAYASRVKDLTASRAIYVLEPA